MVLVSAILCAFGLAVLYSSSAFVAVADHGSSMFFFIRQVDGLAAGILMFLVAAKLDAEKLRRWAWPVMWLTIVTMAAVLVLPGRIAPTIHGSKRFLFGASFQPSEFAKLAVVVWMSMLIVKKGDNLRRFAKGLIPFVAVIGVLDVFAALEPDLSVAMLLTLLDGASALRRRRAHRPLHRARRDVSARLHRQSREAGTTRSRASWRSCIPATRRRG